VGTNILNQLAELERLSMKDLKERWRALFGTEPPGFNRVFLTRRLAHRIQDLAYGGLPQSAKDEMARVLDEEGYDELGRSIKPASRGGGNGTGGSKAIALAPGTLLIREWEGERHEVRALTEGFEYRGRRFKSLSVIARTITGTRWSGPKFFGLRRRTPNRVETGLSDAAT
jgi:hypothetical protein